MAGWLAGRGYEVREEPRIARAALLATVRERYGIAAEGLTFVPVGYAAACYVLRGAGGERFFLKVWPVAADGGPHSAWRAGSLRLARAIHERGVGLTVPYPLPTADDALWADVAGSPLALFPFLAGASPTAWSPPLREAVARALAVLHRATPVLADVLPPRETFALPFVAALRRDLAGLEAIGEGDRAGLRALRDWLSPRRDETLAQVARLERLQGIVRALPGPVVVCHTDIGAENLLVDDAGRVAVLDWDEATLAPPEYDLYAACEMGDSAGFLAAYGAEGRRLEVEGRRPKVEGGASGVRLHVDHFAFALLRRAVGDMAVRVREVLGRVEGGRSKGEGGVADAEMLARDLAVLREIEAWGFGMWRGLDATLDGLAAALADQAG